MGELDTDRLLLIVVGAHLRAEAYDRPLAYQLQQQIKAWIEANVTENQAQPAPLVCTDVWQLNNNELHQCPLICIGGPNINALAAYLYPRLPTALQIEQKLIIQLDLDFGDLRANVWGMSPEHTSAAVELFERKYLDAFMNAVVAQM